MAYDFQNRLKTSKEVVSSYGVPKNLYQELHLLIQVCHTIIPTAVVKASDVKFNASFGNRVSSK